MIPAAPTTFSTTTVWPMFWDILAASRRAATSTALPAASGTIMRMGLAG